ncbi:MAG: L-seryl-tRNA(Sec) selenium transferase [Desulfosudaceae bacterium]
MDKTNTEKNRVDENQHSLLQNLPGVDTILTNLGQRPELAEIPTVVLTNAARGTVAEMRQAILESPDRLTAVDVSPEEIAERTVARARDMMTPNLDAVINATGVVVHTNLGRSPLAPAAMDHLRRVAAGYSNLEFDLELGRRGLRYACVEELLRELTGAEAALVVNNNAGAVLLALESLARDREVIVSRGELIEIGGSFRIPEVMEKSGCRLKEVGTTNRTHPADYREAISDQTALLMKVHTSNYGLVGFTAEVSLEEMSSLGREHDIPVMNDLGSGTFIDFAEYGLAHEPTISDAVAAGADIVTFSGDKLLGGPQAGIIVGKKSILTSLRKNPLTRALRIDKLTLAALEITLRQYRDKNQAVQTIPTLRMITAPVETIREKAASLAASLNDLGHSRLEVSLQDSFSRAGGGSFPFLKIPTQCVVVRVKGLSSVHLEKELRQSRPPIIGRIEKDHFLMDPRTVADSEFSVIKDAFATILKQKRT